MVYNYTKNNWLYQRITDYTKNINISTMNIQRMVWISIYSLIGKNINTQYSGMNIYLFTYSTMVRYQ